MSMGDLEELQISNTIGKVWTTDAIYRETPDKVKGKNCCSSSMQLIIWMRRNGMQEV